MNLNQHGCACDVIQKKGIVEMYFHPEWSGNKRKGSDLVLLKLDSPSSFPPIKFPECCLSLKDDQLFSSLGWGRSSPGGAFAINLRIGRPNYVNSDECRRTGTNLGFIEHGMMCAGGDGGGLCEGQLLLPGILSFFRNLPNLTDGRLNSFR